MYAPKATVSRARSLRRRMTPPEARLWVALRRKAVEGLRFRRQHPVGPYVLDFYCEAARLCVEVDGQTHWLGAAPARDADRDAWLAARGVKTLRLPASVVLGDLDAAVRTILAHAEERRR
ncbi:endonuclease domain-containing protein [Phenylobacterium sp.]|uniref:endonuclease domain-containing protein n=1 Tax=Phenylobacterium sp. TaxID=1871053 RepID=UPI00392552C0